MKRLLLFAWLWLLTGFTSGSATLLGPLRWITEHGRAEGWSEGYESGVARLVMALFVIVSFAVALWLTRCVLRSGARHVRLGIPAILLLCAGSTLWLWLTPELMAGESEGDTTVAGSFTFGPYPSEERLRELKSRGFTGVVSLLHPAVVPFELKLIGDGRKAAERAGLEYVHVPLLPWVGDNRESLGRIEGLVAREQGKFYVHCYLGKDRVRLVKNLVTRLDPDAALAVPDRLAKHERRRRLKDGLRWERGAVAQLGDGLYLTPYPTDDEMMSYLLPGTHGGIVSLLDPSNPEDVPWIERERMLLEQYRVPFTSIPLPPVEFTAEQLEQVARRIAGMQRPLVVHAFLDPLGPRSPATARLAELLSAMDAPPPPVASVDPESEPATESVSPAAEPGFLRRAMPDPRSVVLLGPPLLLFACLAAAFAGWLRKGRGVRAPYTRKIFHFVIFTAAGTLQLVAGLSAVVLFGGLVSAVVLYAVLRGDGYGHYEAMARPTDAPRRSLFILLPLATTAVGGVLANLLFGVFAFVGYLVVGWGDAIAEPVGTAWGRHRYRVPSIAGVAATRSLEGSFAVFAVGGAAAFIGLSLYGTSLPLAAGIALACGVVGSLVEAISNHGLDNLTVQLAASGVAFYLLA